MRGAQALGAGGAAPAQPRSVGPVRGGGRAGRPMWAVRSPDAAAPSPSRSPELAAPPDSSSPGSSPGSVPSSLGSSPGSVPSSLGSSSVQPDSLQALPESPSIQCDSLECPCCGGSSESPSVCEDSLQPPLAPCRSRGGFGERRCNPLASSELCDSLESRGVQHDSLQSVSSLRESLRSSSITGDSLESLASLSSGSASRHSGLEFATS